MSVRFFSVVNAYERVALLECAIDVCRCLKYV